MPFDDPKALEALDWGNLHLWLTLLWIFFPLVITFAFSMMMAHAFIPSAVLTGHLPARASTLRLPLTVFGLLAAVAAGVLFIFALIITWDTLSSIFVRIWV
jgi:hypothetical protein